MSWTNRYVLTALFLVFVFTSTTSAVHAQWFTGSLASPANRADYVIVTRTQFTSVVAPLAALRSSRNGYTVMTVLMDSIASQFHRVTPDSSLRDFIVTMTGQWQQPRPRFCLLAGAVSHVPSHKQPSPLLLIDGYEDSVLVDQWLVTTPGSGIPFPPPLVALGRMPAWSAAELQVMVEKTIAYERAQPGPWARRSIAVADSSDMGWMEEVASEYQEFLAPGWADTIDVHVRPTSPFYRSPEAFQALWGDGCAFVSFIGHGNWRQFSGGAYFTTDDIRNLLPRDELPVCILLGKQLIGSPDTVTMAAALLKAPQRGAVCVLAPTGLVYLVRTEELHRSLFAYQIAHRGEPIGTAWKVGLSNGRVDNLTRWTLFGDPALVVKTADIASLPPEATPAGFALHQNYPNPFNPATTVRFAVPVVSHVSLRVYNALGQEVTTLFEGDAAIGLHEVRFDASQLASGLYVCRMFAGSYVASQKMMLVR